MFDPLRKYISRRFILIDVDCLIIYLFTLMCVNSQTFHAHILHFCVYNTFGLHLCHTCLCKNIIYVCEEDFIIRSFTTYAIYNAF